jgi:hypothetical protein
MSISPADSVLNVSLLDRSLKELDDKLEKIRRML